MLPVLKRYAIYPSVIKVGVKSEMKIVALERAFLFVDGAKYTLDIMGVNTDVIDYHAEKINNRVTIEVEGKDGYIKFDYAFNAEMEYVLSLRKNGKLVQDLVVYALEDDLYALTPLRGDFHSHSFRSDGCHCPVAHAGHYREQGYDFTALTDHNRYYPCFEGAEAFDGVKTGFTRVFGEEVHCPENVTHIVHVFGKESVAIKYVLDESGTYADEIKEYEASVPSSVPEIYRGKYARCKWACDQIHKAGGLAIFAHPYWRLSVKCYNVCTEFSKILIKSGMFDAFELIGGMGIDGVNTIVSLWSELRAEGCNIPVVGSSDVHNMQTDYSFPAFFTVCFAKGNDSDSIKESVKNGLCVAVETANSGYQIQHRAYGSHRLVMYAHFLFKHYFPERMRIVEGEGVAMRQYAMGDAPKDLIEMIAKQSQNYTDRFFGRAEPVLPSKEILDFEDKWRKVHLEKGPNSKGSSINVDPPTFQI
jgi:hypothetical protein